jgi:hypothetical protein
MEQALSSNDPALPAEYIKVFRSYLSVRDRKQGDDHTKALIREHIVRLQQQKGISTYRIYTDLQLNHGNMNTYIKHGDVSKVSLDMARSAMAYMERI